MATTITKKKIHYGWVIVFSCFLIMCFGMCIILNCSGLFIKPVTESLGISRRAFSYTQLMISAAMILVSFAAGKIFAKFRVKPVMICGTVFMSISYTFFAFASALWQFYLISFCTGFCLALTAQVPVGLLMNRWFTKKRGLATGLVFMGSGLGGVLLNSAISYVISAYGWRTAYLGLGILMFLTMVPSTIFLIRATPEEMGLEPYGGYAQGQSEPIPIEQMRGLTLREALHTFKFWQWFAGAFVASATCCAVVQQMTAYTSDIGYPYMMAANISAINLGLLACGKMTLGGIMDKLSVRSACLMCISGITIALVLLMFAQNFIFLILSLILFGLCCAFTTVAYPIVTEALFGQKDYSSIYGWVIVANCIGQAVSSLIAASIYDATGSYLGAWIFYGLLCVITLISFLFLFRTSKKKQKTSI